MQETENQSIYARQTKGECSDCSEDKCNTIKKYECPLSLQRSIDIIVKREGFVTYDINIKPISTLGGNYMADLCEIDIKGWTGKSKKEVNLFVKTMLQFNTLTFFCISDMYTKEIFVYTKLLEMYKQIQEDENVPISERYKTIKFYDTGNSEAIIMENMIKKGFKVINRTEIISLNFAKAAVIELAKFHALGFVIKEKKPNFFKKHVNSLKAVFQETEELEDFIKHLFDSAVNVLRSEEAKIKLRNYSRTSLDKYLKYLFVRESNSSAKNICHGDYRVNNILCLEEEGEILQLIPVDYQIIYYGNPVDDFTYFIFGATDRQFRKDHFDNLKELYYETLKTFLQYFNIKVENFYPKKEFEEDLKSRLDHGLMSGIQLAPFVLASEDDVPDLSEDSLTVPIPKSKAYVNRINELVDDFIEWGYL